MGHTNGRTEKLTDTPDSPESSQTPSIKIFGADLPGGVYLLRICLGTSTAVAFGRHRGGRPVHLPVGTYVYVGSAHGRQGASTLANRLLRHAARSGTRPPHKIREQLRAALPEAGLSGEFRARKSVHWHIDYLLDLPEAEITGLLAMRTYDKLEKSLAERLAASPEAVPVSPGLGASDHPGHSHLFALKRGSDLWENVVEEWEQLQRT